MHDDHPRETARPQIDELKDHDQRQKLQDYPGRLLVLHTENDQFLDRSHAERLCAWGGGSDKRLVVFWGVFGVRPATDGVTLTDDGPLRATFGLFKLETPLDNADGAHITRNYRWWTAAGARGSMKDDGLTFGTNANAGQWCGPVPKPR